MSRILALIRRSYALLSLMLICMHVDNVALKIVLHLASMVMKLSDLLECA